MLFIYLKESVSLPLHVCKMDREVLDNFFVVVAEVFSFSDQGRSLRHLMWNDAVKYFMYCL